MSPPPAPAAPPHVIGVDAGGTKLLAAAVGQDLEVSGRELRLWGERRRDEVLDLIERTVADVLRAAPGASAVGVGLASLVDPASGSSMTSVHLPLEGVPFRELMSERLGLPVHVDNDANLAALAEHRHGAARGTGDAVVLTLGTGVGGGVVLGGRLHRGASGAGAELGHMTIDFHGPPCQGGCPNHGCLEVFASGPALGREGERRAREEPGEPLGRALAGGEPITGELVTRLAVEGDPGARAAVRAVGERLGDGLVGIVNAFGPEVVAIGGGAAAAGELLLEPARRAVEERALRPNRERVRVVRARFGPEAAMIGAAIFAMEEGRA